MDTSPLRCMGACSQETEEILVRITKEEISVDCFGSMGLKRCTNLRRIPIFHRRKRRDSGYPYNGDHKARESSSGVFRDRAIKTTYRSVRSKSPLPATLAHAQRYLQPRFWQSFCSKIIPGFEDRLRLEGALFV